MDKWAFTSNPCLTIVCYEVVKNILIATLDSVILFPFVKWTISEVLLAFKYDVAFQILLLSIIVQVSNIVIFNTVCLLKSILILLFLFLWIFCLYSCLKPLSLGHENMCFGMSKQDNYIEFCLIKCQWVQPQKFQWKL